MGSESAIIHVFPLGFPWKTQDPFLFCVHHHDFYPKGNENQGPKASLAGRSLGEDFEENPEGWRMYHGTKVPGFPAHPHRGFETITIVNQGYVDHSDSIGAAARFGNGDTQWMTAGKGVQHSEMFPLVNQTEDNPLELFQIWLNLPAKSKMVSPYFTMFWNEEIPFMEVVDAKGLKSSIKIIAGNLWPNHKTPTPPPDSWAHDPANEVAVVCVTMEPNASFHLPLSSGKINRSLFFYEGKTIVLNETQLSVGHGVVLNATQEVTIMNGENPSSFLVLQGKPIQEPVAQYGPFVMNTQREIQEAFAEYQRTEFGGWPWPSYEPVHAQDQGRFALYPDGRKVEKV